MAPIPLLDGLPETRVTAYFLPVSRCVLLPTGSIQAGRLPCVAMITRELEAQWRRESIVAFDIFAMRCLIPDEANTEEETLAEIEG